LGKRTARFKLNS